MRYFLDTNICVYVINGRMLQVRERLLKENPSDVCISSICVGELAYGAAKSNFPAKNSKAMKVFCSNFQVLPFDDEDAAAFGYIRANLERRGCPIGPYDMQIAAQALAKKLTLVTNNVREFERVPSLKIDNWV